MAISKRELYAMFGLGLFAKCRPQTMTPRNDCVAVAGLCPDEVLRLAPRLQRYVQSPAPTWREIVAAARRLRRDFGMFKQEWDEDCRTLGPEAAAIAMGVAPVPRHVLELQIINKLARFGAEFDFDVLPDLLDLLGLDDLHDELKAGLHARAAAVAHIRHVCITALARVKAECDESEAEGKALDRRAGGD